MSKRCSILIVEDDALVGKYLATILAGVEMDPVGPFGTVGDALDAIRTCIFDAGESGEAILYGDQACEIVVVPGGGFSSQAE